MHLRSIPSALAPKALQLTLAAAFFGAASSPPAQAQGTDPQELMNQLNALTQQLASAPDPCIVMPRLKALILQVANTSPEVYQAMKPSLDLITQDDSCTTPGPTPTQPDTPTPDTSALTPEQQQQRQAERQATLARLQQAEQKAAAQGDSRTVHLGAQGQAVPSTATGVTCDDVTDHIILKVTSPKGFGHCDKEVVGHFTSNYDDIATCTTAFHHNGVWDDYGMGTVKPGQTTGGEMGGFWTCGADLDEVRYVCFRGDTPMDSKNHICNANIRW